MRDYHFEVKLTQLREAVVGESARTLWMLLGAVALVLVIACANVANLFLVRIETKRREMALRTALGAGRAHLALHYLAESVLLSLVAGAVALALAWGAIHVLVTVAPTSIPRLAEVRVGWSGFIFAAAVSLGIGVVFGVIPLGSRAKGVSALNDGSRGMTASRGRHAVRGALVVTQVALAVVLLAAGGVLLRSFERLRSVRPGFDANGVIAFDVSLPFTRYRDYQSTGELYSQLQTRLATLPGVESAGAITSLPLDGGGPCGIIIGDADSPPGAAQCIRYAYVTPGYFETMGIALRGAQSDWSAVSGEHAGVVISGSVAKRFWPDQSALDRVLHGGDNDNFFRVTGVTGDVRIDDLREPSPEIVYYPVVPAKGTSLWTPARSITVVLKVKSSDPLSLVPAIRRTLAQIDPTIPIANPRAMPDVVARSMARLSFTMLLLGIAGVMALVLSAVGLYGVISYIVSERRGEIGLRIALGAGAREVGAMVVLQSVRLTAIGVAIGLAGAIATTRVVSSLLFEVSATDPLTLLLAGGFLVVVAALASYWPARRAARVDPIEVLRA
jgi:predicted permease